jgi:hypothetical protein
MYLAAKPETKRHYGGDVATLGQNIFEQLLQ